MDEKWLEKIKYNNAIALLEKYFPGLSFGNKTLQAAEICHIAEQCGVADTEEISKLVLLQLGDQEKSSNDFDTHRGLKIIGKRYISDANASKTGTCIKCLEFSGRIFKWPDEILKMPILPRHPNCRCYYENIYEPDGNKYEIKNPSSMQRQVHFHVKGSPALPKILGGSQEFAGWDDLLDQLENKYPPHSIKYLVISNHGSDNSFDIGGGDNIEHIGNGAGQIKLKRLKRMLAPDATLEIRMCRTISSKEGDDSAQHIADLIGCKVIAYRNPVSIAGGKAPNTFQMPEEKIFYPRIEK